MLVTYDLGENFMWSNGEIYDTIAIHEEGYIKLNSISSCYNSSALYYIDRKG